MNTKQYQILSFLIVFTLLFGGSAIWFQNNYRIMVNTYFDLSSSSWGERYYLTTTSPPESLYRGLAIVFETTVTHGLYKQDQKIIKKIAALPGDRITAEGDKFYINGQLTAERPILANIRKLEIPQFAEDFDIVIPDGHFAVLGENLDVSFDSRYYGSVPESQILYEVVTPFG
ncbi:hypothetical protein A3715_17185 [Oleiphilus sp. HI0009]|nr:hypothetical protein A3715_17185 [Oleiphilus sp. HI0009]